MSVLCSRICCTSSQCKTAKSVTGLGALVLTPVVGNLSDRHGRKALLALPATATIVPLGILACGRTRAYLYAYYAAKTLTAMVAEGCMLSLSLAYVADRVPGTRRAAAFGVFSGVCSAGLVASTVAARALSVSSTCQVAALAAVAAAVYMKAFLQETDGGASSCGADDQEAASHSQPLCMPSSSSSSCEEASPRLPPLRKAPSLSEIAALLTSSSTFSKAAVITFFHGVGEAGLLNTLLYFLKAKFHYSKNQYADLLLIIGITASVSQVLTVMPLLLPKLGERKLLTIALIASCGNAFLYSIAWSSLVPYFAASLVILSMLVTPCVRSIVSKVGPFEQGMVQGCITGISSTANVISPLIFTPLTAWCLSEATPFYLKGFSLACAGFAMLVALATSISVIPAEVQPDRKHMIY